MEVLACCDKQHACTSIQKRRFYLLSLLEEELPLNITPRTKSKETMHPNDLSRIPEDWAAHSADRHSRTWDF
jgi:hypothetical protein